MRPQDVVFGLERNVSERGRLQEHEEEFEQEQAEAYDESIADNDAGLRLHHDTVLATVLAIIEKQEVELASLTLSDQERSALEALQTAFAGKDARYNDFVYAEQRRELLEQALAALQPALALDVSEVPELHETYERIIEEVTQLREHLGNLEDAQDDERLAVQKTAVTDKDDDDEQDDEQDGDEQSAEAQAEAPKKSSLYGDEQDQVAAESGAPPAAAAGERSGVLSRIGRALGIGGRGKEPEQKGS